MIVEYTRYKIDSTRETAFPELKRQDGLLTDPLRDDLAFSNSSDDQNGREASGKQLSL
jgi:hypothetical protein